MEEKVWKKILDEAGDIGVYSAKFNYRGEPLLHKDIDKMVAYAKEVGLIDVYFNTNAVKLNEKMINKLIDAGLDRISISFEGFEKELYEKNRVGAVFENVVDNIKLLQNIKQERGVDYPLVRVQTVLIPELLGREQEYLAFWQPTVDEVAYLDMKNETGDHRGTIYDWACPQLWQRMTIMWDGTLLPCCHDIYGWMAFGNVMDLSIKEMWKSEKAQEYRRLHREGLAHEIPACDRCPLRESEIAKLRDNEV